jgi:predicted nucleotidyltransferase
VLIAECPEAAFAAGCWSPRSDRHSAVWVRSLLYSAAPQVLVEGYGQQRFQPMTPSERKALDDYVSAVRQHYGPRLVDILVFGSRARGDARPDSDVDLVVILKDGDWRFWDEKHLLTDLGYDAMLEPGLWIQAWPVSRSVWEEEDLRKVPFFVIGARPEA